MSTRGYADDIIYGGLGNDFLHGGSGDDAISGAEALASCGRLVRLPTRHVRARVRSDYTLPFNPGNVLGTSRKAANSRCTTSTIRCGQIRSAQRVPRSTSTPPKALAQVTSATWGYGRTPTATT